MDCKGMCGKHTIKDNAYIVNNVIVCYLPQLATDTQCCIICCLPQKAMDILYTNLLNSNGHTDCIVCYLPQIAINTYTGFVVSYLPQIAMYIQVVLCVIQRRQQWIYRLYCLLSTVDSNEYTGCIVC